MRFEIQFATKQRTPAVVALINSFQMLRSVILALAFVAASGGGDRPRLRPLPATDENLQTGPAIGQPIPSFEAIDQTGQTRSFESLRGPHGLALIFIRSADW